LKHFRDHQQALTNPLRLTQVHYAARSRYLRLPILVVRVMTIAANADAYPIALLWRSY
jgi:hypothetical protein